METLNISLAADLQSFVEEQAAERGDPTGSAFVGELIRRERDRLELRKLLLEGAASPRAGPADEAYFEGLRQRIAIQARKRA